MITSTTNNIFITAYNTFGITLFQESSGCLGKGFKKAKRDTRYTFKKLMNVAFRSLTKINIYYIYLKFKNTFFDKVDFCFNYLEKFSFKVISIQEIKKLPYNGCRLKKEKRK